MILEFDRSEGGFSIFHDTDGNIYNIITEKIDLSLAEGDSVNAERADGSLIIISKNEEHKDTLEESITSLLERIKQKKNKQ